MRVLKEEKITLTLNKEEMTQILTESSTIKDKMPKGWEVTHFYPDLLWTEFYITVKPKEPAF